MAGRLRFTEMPTFPAISERAKRLAGQQQAPLNMTE